MKKLIWKCEEIVLRIVDPTEDPDYSDQKFYHAEFRRSEKYAVAVLWDDD